MSYSQQIANLDATKHFFQHNPYSKVDYDEKKNNTPPCRFCGAQGHKDMYIIKENGNGIWWSCRTEKCLGNQDTPRPKVTNREHIEAMNKVGDTSKLWRSMRPII